LKYSLDPWIERLDFYYNWLRYALRLKDPDLVRRASILHAESALDVYEVLKDIRRPSVRRNPAYRIPLERLERDFYTLRERAEREAALADKLASRSAIGRRAVQAAKRIALATRLAARTLKAEMVRRGAWTEEYGDAIGLNYWLR
jgi:hypothetical protein